MRSKQQNEFTVKENIQPINLPIEDKEDNIVPILLPALFNFVFWLISGEIVFPTALVVLFILWLLFFVKKGE